MSLRTLAWVLLAQAIGGISPALTKLALAGLEPWSLVFARQLLGVAFLLLMVARRDLAAPTHRGVRETVRNFDSKDWALMLLLAWAGFALPQVLNAFGLQLSSATNGALLSPLEPIGILIGGAIFLREPLTLARTGAVALGLGGATLIVLQSNVDAAAGNLRGDMLMTFGHLAWAIYTLAAKPLLDRHDPLVLAIVAGVLSPLPLAPLAATESFELARALPALGWIVLLAFLGSAVAIYAWNRALRDISAGTMAAFIFVQPLVGLVAGALLGEPLGTQALLGAALIVAGVTIATLRAEDRSSD